MLIIIVYFLISYLVLQFKIKKMLKKKLQFNFKCKPNMFGYYDIWRAN